MIASAAARSDWQRTLAILFLGQLFTAAGFASFFPFLPLYVRDLGAVTNLSVDVLAGLAYSAQAFTMMLASPIWGALADRFGRKLMVERAMFGGTIVLLLMAFARSAEELVLLRAVQGLITGTIAAANALAASVVPRQRIGFAMGLLQVGSGAGVALGPLMGGLIADAYGYNAAFYVTAATLFFSGLLVWRFIHEDFAPPEQPRVKKAGLISSWKTILATPGVAITFSMRFLSQMGRNLLLPIAPVFVQTLLVDTSRLNTFTGLVVGGASFTTTLSAVYLGRLGDRTGHRRVLIAGAAVAVLLYFLHIPVQAAWQLLALQALVGVAMGGIIPAISALLANFTSAGDAGAVYGLDNSIDAAGRTLGPILGSAVAVWFSLRSTFAATALLYLLAAMMAWRFLPRKAGVNPIG
jgi:MFS transporter, DHA1 family, multidrug resistance protein